MKSQLIAVLFPVTLIFIGQAVAQTLPTEMYYSPNGRILYTGGQPATGLYDKNSVKNVYLNFPQSNYWSLLTANYASETNIPATLVYDSVSYDSVGVRFRGNTSYTQIGTSQKKSFSVELDFYRPNQLLLGYTDLKLNNAHGDHTMMREVLYSRMAARYIPIAKTNYVRLYLNNVDWGLYPSIQNVDKRLLKQWFLSNNGARFRATKENTGIPQGGWGDGKAGMNYLGADSALYNNYYSLKSSDIPDPWAKLVTAFHKLSLTNVATLDTVKAYIDIDKALWFLAVENIFTDDDSYVMKGKMDYMIYYEPETGRTTPLEYDGNSTFQSSLATSTSWGPFKNATNVNYPLLNKLLNVPELRQRYLAHYRVILQETFTTSNANALIDELNAQINAHVMSDTKKLYSNTQYTNGIPTLKNFVANRRAYLLSNVEVAQQAPIIQDAPFYNSQQLAYVAPLSNEVVTVKATLASSPIAQAVYLYYSTGLVGNFTKSQMFDDGAHQDGAAGDGVYGGSIPGFQAATLVRYYIEAIANTAAKSAYYLPLGAEHDVFVYTVQAASAQNGVVINELVASNAGGAVDSAGNHDDWLELYNNNGNPVDLSGFYITDNPANLNKWQFPPATNLPAFGYLVLWADEEQIQGPFHTNFKLSALGEDLIFSDTALNTVDQLVFPAQTTDVAYARNPNGTGNFVFQQPTFGSHNEFATAVKRPAKAHRLVIYPNPTSDFIHIRLENPLEETLIWDVYDSKGTRMATGKTNASDIETLQCAEWNAGMYVVRIQKGNTLHLARFIKQ